MILPPLTDIGADEVLERQCLSRVAAGDRTAFEDLYRRLHPRLVRFLRRFCGRADLIDEVINDTLWVVWRQAASFRGDSKVSTWIIGIAYRSMLKALRGVPVSELTELGEDESVAGASDDAELRDWVACGLRSLPEDQRETLELAYFLGCSVDEIAAIMGCAAGTVKARMFRARLRLRTVMPLLGGRQHPKTGESA
ncbi:MAG: RNA polymerase sigma factor [Paucibacter sp.]|nr:RNA polymerase sigma factor [Roseateles sp.]